MSESVDAIVIGSGQGGVPFAEDLALHGKNVVLFERGRLGGSCVNYGCTPSKAFLAAAHNAGRARRAASLGVHASVRVDFPAVMNRTRAIRDDFMLGTAERLEKAGVHVVHAEASFCGERTVRGGDRTVSAPIVVIDTGTTAAIPNLRGLAGTPYLTNESFFELRELPRRLLVLGGGYIGLELGQGIARCGGEVHIVDHNTRVLAHEEADASEALQSSLHDDGMHLHLGTEVKNVEHDGTRFILTLHDGELLEGEALLLCLGRQPNTAALDAAAGGVKLDARGIVVVDKQLRTTSPGVYAIGDVAGQPQFTHVSYEDYRRLVDIIAGGSRTRDDRVLGYTTFTEPQVARVGMTLDETRKAGIAAHAITMPLKHVARAQEWDLMLGFYRLVVDRDTDKILGATMVGYEAGEIVHVILAHMEAGSTWQVLDRSVHIHPTFAEGLPTLARLFTDGG